MTEDTFQPCVRATLRVTEFGDLAELYAASNSWLYLSPVVY